ncbi:MULTISPECIES: DUF2325 domain-containing protein [unclassified Duganella]|uniref:DUF2325 domain-containing protein n=1 Tax=unclassified Duganella TaxID=2636909 RepID=UPI00087FEEB7|nr:MULTISPECIES: DUF2325 domain-containing protein [unclassified Duganella]SDF39224.1 hypothetical protein SAMN05216320_10142 [Duganella sp. OV458]SDI87312.1 hypothetical protein SAMN05428973_1011382 [Duganella sp. OV510]
MCEKHDPLAAIIAASMPQVAGPVASPVQRPAEQAAKPQVIKPIINNVLNVLAKEPEAQASRRRRLWELGHACHCPLVGVGFPLGVLRKLVDKVTNGKVVADDYEVHVGAVTECGSRNRLSEALQKELERRYAAVLLRFRNAKSTEQVADMWRNAVNNGDVAGAFWAGLTHPRCTSELEEQMCRDLHMVQHQAGACVRADITKFNATLDENKRLTHDLAKAQQRAAALMAEKTTDAEKHAAQLMQLRAQVVGKDSMVDSLKVELEQLRDSIPGLESRAKLAERLGQMEERERAMRQQMAELRVELARALEAPVPVPEAAPQVVEHVMKMPLSLRERAVLCVGGRNGNVASYRELIEREGAQFSHHDGGLEDNANRLEASLAAADLVICQTGCISHSAYWRVKDYCKRNGKRCVFIDNPSISSLARGLEQASAV